MVAKSYQTFTIEGEPYILSGKAYVNVRNPKTSAVKAVRWYTEKEYAKMYPKVKAIAAAPADSFKKTQKEVLGFDKGYITIFKGDTYSNLEWYQLSAARYTRWWGWYFPSNEPVPADVPNEAVQLPWDAVGNEDGTLKNEDAVRIAVEALLYDASNSLYQGKIGDRLEVEITVQKVIKLENGFGSSNMMIMFDNDGNEYVWTTAAKCWPVGETKLIRGTVKEHRMYKNRCQTILTRCMEREY